MLSKNWIGGFCVIDFQAFASAGVFVFWLGKGRKAFDTPHPPRNGRIE
jgi:hypothetical protein